VLQCIRKTVEERIEEQRIRNITELGDAANDTNAPNASGDITFTTAENNVAHNALVLLSVLATFGMMEALATRWNARSFSSDKYCWCDQLRSGCMTRP
jgi:hypothetical protein